MKSLSQVDADLKNHWYIAALSHEVKSKKPLRRVIYDQPLVLFRNNTGKVSAFEDKCIHRGAQLSLGKCRNGNIQCPYHGWEYNSHGDLVSIPSEGNDAQTTKVNDQPVDHKTVDEKPNYKSWHLKSLDCLEQDGVIWVWMGSLSNKTNQLPWRFPFFQHKGWQQYFMITDFENEVGHLVQNFMDVPHTVFVHDKWFRKRRNIQVPVDISVTNSRVKVVYHQANDQIGFSARILNPQNEPVYHSDEYIFPNVTRVDYRLGATQFIINSQCTPVTRYQTRVYTWICYRIPIWGFLLKPFFQYYTRKVITQDVEIMANQGRNLKHFEQNEEPIASSAREGFKSCAADELHLAIDKMRELGKTDRVAVEQMSYHRQREFWI